MTTVRDNRFTFKNADDMGTAEPVVFTSDDMAELLAQYAQQCRIILRQRAGYFEAVLQAALHNHWTIAKAMTELEGPSAYANSVQQVLPAAIAAGVPAYSDSAFPAMHEAMRLISDEHNALQDALKQAFQQAVGNHDSCVEVAVAMQSALYTYCAALGCALRVPSPEMWPTPPDVWKPVRAQLASVESKHKDPHARRVH